MAVSLLENIDALFALQGSPRSRLAVMQTLEDYSSAGSGDEEGYDIMQGFVAGLSTAQQV